MIFISCMFSWMEREDHIVGVQWLVLCLCWLVVSEWRDHRAQCGHQTEARIGHTSLQYPVCSSPECHTISCSSNSELATVRLEFI